MIRLVDPDYEVKDRIYSHYALVKARAAPLVILYETVKEQDKTLKVAPELISAGDIVELLQRNIGNLTGVYLHGHD